MKKYLTIEDLLAFCKQSNMNTFSAKDAGGPIIIQSFGEISAGDTTTMGLTPCTLQACHTELNKNQSYIEDSVMKKALSSFSNRPILGYVYQLDDGSWDFWDHRMKIEEDGDETRVEYLERPIGVIPESCNAHLEYDEEQQKNYVVVNGYIYDDYGNRALDIIKANNGKVWVSVELGINAMSYNAKENYLNIEDFTFLGVTCLGKNPDGTVVQPGMEGSNLKLDNFSAKQNSMFSENADYQEKLIKTLEKLNGVLERFNINSDKKGGNEMDKLNELLTKYGKTGSDITFETEGLSDEELEAKFKEVFGDNTSESDAEPIVTEEEACGKKKKKCSDEDDEPVATEEEACGKKKKKCSDEGSEEYDEPIAIEDEACGKKKKKCSNEDEAFVLKYELSHDDIRAALYQLLDEYSDNGYCNCWIAEVYDNKFVYQDYSDGKYYRRGYTKDGDNVSLMDNRIEVFNEWLSKEEKDALDTLKADYAELKSFKENYEAAQVKAQKDEVFAKKSYEKLAGVEAFEELKKNAENFSLDEVINKAKIIYADFMEKAEVPEEESKKSPRVIGVSFNQKEKTKKAYGNLFN